MAEKQVNFAFLYFVVFVNNPENDMFMIIKSID